MIKLHNVISLIYFNTKENTSVYNLDQSSNPGIVDVS